MKRTKSSKPPPNAAGVNENRPNSASNSATTKKSRLSPAPDTVHTTQSLRIQQMEIERKWKESLAAKDRELAALKLQAAKIEHYAAEAKRRKSTGSCVALLSMADCPKEEKSGITNCVAKHVWKLIGFMPLKPDLQAGIMRLVYSKLDPPPPKQEVSESYWVKSRVNIVGSVFNQIRSYISGNLRKAIFTYVTKHCDKKWPNLDKIRACALRTIEVTAPEDATDEEKEEAASNMEVFVFYWDGLLPYAGPPTTKMWDKNVRHIYRITDPVSYSNSPIAAQMEAHLVVCLENNWQYWQNWYALEQKFPNHTLARAPKDKIPPQGDRAHTDGYFEEPATKKVYFFGPKFDTLYSKANAGSCVTGGWSDEGKQRFTNLVRDIRNNRQTQRNYDMEDMVFEAVMKKLDKDPSNLGGTAGVSGANNNSKEEYCVTEDVLDPEVAMALGLIQSGDNSHTDDDDDRKMPALPQLPAAALRDHGDEDEYSAGSLEDDHLPGPVSARASI